jgi:hypothetical protein
MLDRLKPGLQQASKRIPGGVPPFPRVSPAPWRAALPFR